MNNQLNQTKEIVQSIVSWIVWLYTDDNLALALWSGATAAAKPLVYAYVCGEVARQKLHTLSVRLEPKTPIFISNVQM